MASTEFICLADYEAYARKTMPKYWWSFYSSGADGEITMRENIKSFKRIQIIPWVLRDVSNIVTATTILGHPISFPVCIAPTAVQAMAHYEGEIGTARAALAMGIGYTQSAYSSQTIDEVADGSDGCLRFMQMQFLTRRDIVQRLATTAERRGYKAIVLTVDDATPGNRIAWDRAANEMGVPPKLKFGNFGEIEANADNGYLCDASGTWSRIQWLKSQTKLPIIVKGILSAEDAELAIENGVSGILVSNHGGRQLDSTPATIDALPEIVKAVNGRCEVYLDGGIRHGTDILKALALGARAVFIGRPVVYALAHSGEAGVRQMLQILKEEFYRSMGLSGCATIADISSLTLRRRPDTSHL